MLVCVVFVVLLVASVLASMRWLLCGGDDSKKICDHKKNLAMVVFGYVWLRLVVLVCVVFVVLLVASVLASMRWLLCGGDDSKKKICDHKKNLAMVVVGCVWLRLVVLVCVVFVVLLVASVLASMRWLLCGGCDSKKKSVITKKSRDGCVSLCLVVLVCVVFVVLLVASVLASMRWLLCGGTIKKKSVITKKISRWLCLVIFGYVWLC